MNGVKPVKPPGKGAEREGKGYEQIQGSKKIGKEGRRRGQEDDGRERRSKGGKRGGLKGLGVATEKSRRDYLKD